MTSDYRPISPKSIPERQIVTDSALATTAIALAAAIALALLGEILMASGLCFGCALAIAVDRFVRWRLGSTE